MEKKTHERLAGSSTQDAGPLVVTAEPETAWTNPGPGLVALLGLAAVGAGAAQVTPQIISLPLRTAQVDPRGATTALALVLGIGTVIQLIAYPVIGRASDRTLARIGRRRPWLFVGALLFLLGSVTMYLAPSIGLMTLGWTINSLGYGATIVAANAVIADQYEPDRRGLPSALVGVGNPTGVVLGLFLAQLMPDSLAAMFFLPTAVGVVGACWLALVLRDRRISAQERPSLDVRSIAGTFWVNPVAHPGFALALGSRFLLFMGVAAANMYQVFFIADVLHIHGPAIPRAIFLSQLVGNGTSLVIAPLVSRLSDRIGRRKPFVITAAIIFAAGLLGVTQASTYGAFLVAYCVVGIGLGVYLAVDLALVTQLLPDPHDTAKDLGLMNLANSLPASLIPAVAPALLAIGVAAGSDTRNYAALFTFGALTSFVGALLIIPIRRIR
ncbi:MFS transporter [Streptomyces sp. NPDC004542]|uniref:MFS transporter n=1 Tax=Streptomyces sp. NPDC004542 TaxID=3154281 RepID=UPI0033AF87C0